MDLSALGEYHPAHFFENVKRMRKEIVCRDQEIFDIHTFLGQTPMDEPPQVVFIYGNTGTGKSLILKSCLKYGKFRYALVNCIETYSMKLIYEGILNQLSNHVMSPSNSFQPYAKCFSFHDFVEKLVEVAEKQDIGKLCEESFSIIIVLDRADELRKLDRTVLLSFLKLREMSNLKLCVVFLSVLPWTNFYSNDSALKPVLYYLCQYTQKQAQAILELDKPEQFSAKFYSNYVNIFLGVFYQACRDVRELKYQASVIFKKYSEPIVNGELTENDTSELWKRSQDFFKKSLKSLYLKMDNDLDLENVEKLIEPTAQALNVELPYYSKYLLIGCYIASFNPPKEDKKFFVKNHGKMKKPKALPQNLKNHFRGPKPFPFQRLLAIVAAILDEDKIDWNADLHIELATLVKMNLIIQMSEDVLDGPVFKSNVGLQFIESISKSVQFPIRKYLIDFMEP